MMFIIITKQPNNVLAKVIIELVGFRIIRTGMGIIVIIIHVERLSKYLHLINRESKL